MIEEIRDFALNDAFRLTQHGAEELVDKDIIIEEMIETLLKWKHLGKLSWS